MIKGEYAEAIGPKDQFKKHWQLRQIAEYEKFFGNCAAVEERLEADYTCDLTNKEESTYHLCVTSVTSQIQMSPQKHILLGNDK